MIKFPSIDQFRHAIKAAKYLSRESNLPEVVRYEGTVKLHGTNAGISIRKNEIKYQSRNNLIDIGSDNCGFAGYMRGIESTEDYQSLIDEVKRYVGDTTEHITVYGEWCGSDVQGGVGISDIGKKIFVIFDLIVGSGEVKKRFDVSELSLHYPDINVYNIHAFKTFEVEVDLNYPQIAQQKLIAITNEVEQECPVAKAFGVEGIGEGVVWKCVSKDNTTNADLWFKVKGAKHSASKVKVLAEVDVEKIESMKKFVDYAVTENRLNQGIDYLNEQHISIDIKSMGEFIRWVFNDVVKEESDVMEESGIEKKELGKYVSPVAREWFNAKLNEEVGL